MIRPRGIAMIGLAIVLFVLAGVTRVGWLLLFDAVLWGIVVVSAATPWLAIGNLRIQRKVTGWQGREDAPGPSEGDAIEIDLQAQNEGLLPSMFVTIRYGLDHESVETGHKSLMIAWLGRKKRASSKFEARFNRRGIHTLSRLRFDTALPFGMFRRTKWTGDATELLIYPKVYPVDGLDMVANSGVTTPNALRARSGDEITGSRDYIQGDPWRHIHWRNTARASRPQVKEFEKTPDNSLTIVFGARNAVENGEESLEHAVKVAASVGDFMCRSGGSVSLLAGRTQLNTSESKEFLTALALIEESSEESFEDSLRKAHTGADILAIVLDTDAEGINALTRIPWGQQRATLVVLKGFDFSRPTLNVPEELGHEGIPIIECRPGEIEKALAALSGESFSNSIPEMANAVS